MHGLVNRSIQSFLQDTYGAPAWKVIRVAAGVKFRDFEAMLDYPDELTHDLLDAACDHLDRPQSDLLEDLGTYLVIHPNMNAVRRLLRFGGHTFDEFIYSLEDLNDRLQLAMPDLELPPLEMCEFSASSFSLSCHWQTAGFGAVLLGILRALADDYGALVLMELVTNPTDDGVTEAVRVEVLETAFASGREFQLAVAAGAA